MSAEPGRRTVVTAIGIAQILAWGCSFYLPAVLAGPIVEDTGWPLAWVVGGLSIASLAAGLSAAAIGRLVQEWGGRLVLAGGAALLAAGLAVMATAPTLPVYLLGWLVAGAGMAASLYDAAFATLGRLYGRDARGPITAVTLFGGFASTVCWPLSALLVEHLGWRGTCLAYAGIQLFLCLPCFLVLLPRHERATDMTRRAAKDVAESGRDRKGSGRIYLLLAGILTLAAFISTTLSVHLLVLLQARGMELAAAVALGALVGPSQVGGRVLEMFFGRRHHPVWGMLASVLLVATGVGLLLAGWPVTALALIVYGAGNGIHTIARGALPLVLFDPQRYALVIGRLARPTLIMQALAPFIGALLLDRGGGALLLGVLSGAALVNLALAWRLWAMTRRGSY